MCERSRMRSAAALREARRRKILENSENRLKLIAGINSSVEKPRVENYLEPTPKPEIETSEGSLASFENPKSEVNSKLNLILNESKELKEISDFILTGDGNVEEEGEEEAEVTTFDLKRGKSLSETFLEKKLHYILLALLVNAMLFFNVGYLFCENVFCPFYTVKIMEVFSQRDLNQLQPVSLLFIAGLPKKLQKLTEVILFVLSVLLSDLCLYLFVFVVGNKITSSLE